MAGNYNDAPSRRMAWDTDGTVMFRKGSSSTLGPSPGTVGATTWSATSTANGNDENPASSYYSIVANTDSHVMFGVIFPEPRELDGTYIGSRATPDGNTWVYYSQDTTNCVDGSWATTGSAFHTSANQDHYRDNITSMAFNSVQGIAGCLGEAQVNTAAAFRTMHFYGVISPGETPDRILFLDTENSDAEFTKVLDFAEVPRGQTQTRTFKIKNNSASLSINTVQVTAEDIYLNAGNWYEFGDGGGSYQATYSVGNMANGAEETIYLKQVIPGGETLGVQAGRIKVSHADLT